MKNSFLLKSFECNKFLGIKFTICYNFNIVIGRKCCCFLRYLVFLFFFFFFFVVEERGREGDRSRGRRVLFF